MNRYILLLVTMFSLYGYAEAENPMLFPNGIYLGEGRYITSSGEQGSYASYADVYDDEWDAAYIRDGQFLSYNAIFYFSEEGFFDVSVTQFGSRERITLHQGDGYCIKNTCHMSVTLNQGDLEETVTFLTKENRIKRLGSLRYIDDQGYEQTIAWEENMRRMTFDYYDEE